MDNLSEIIKKRSTPGILIFDMDNKLLYSNETALRLIPDLKNIPQEIYDLCSQKIKSITTKDKIRYLNCSILKADSGISYSMRALLIKGYREPKSTQHIMILIEGITDKHFIDDEKARKEFKLTRRELEVLRLICGGYTNSEISELLFISEYTVKDHIKNIMRKMNVNSRSEIIYCCME